jgi:hypothetical protein
MEDPMGKTIKRSFFEADEVVFVGYSKRHEAFCEAIAKAYRKLGMEAALGCPMMVLGGGFHRFHGFLAGVRK